MNFKRLQSWKSVKILVKDRADFTIENIYNIQLNIFHPYLFPIGSSYISPSFIPLFISFLSLFIYNFILIYQHLLSLFIYLSCPYLLPSYLYLTSSVIVIYLCTQVIIYFMGQTRILTHGVTKFTGILLLPNHLATSGA